MKAVVWSKTNCPQCTKSKQLLESMGIEYDEKVIGEGYNREDLLEAIPTAKSVPQIFLDNVYVGGHVELVNMLTQTVH